MKEIYDSKQPLSVMCESGRVFFYTDEEEVTVSEPTVSGADDDGNPIYEDKDVTKYAYNVTRYDNPNGRTDSLSAAKDMMVELIGEYDNSDSVNNINVVANGMTIPYWRNRSDRVSLRNSIESCKRLGATTFSLEVSTKYPALVIDIDKLLDDMDVWEEYAQNCYCVTQSHLRNIEGMSDVSTVLSYDYKAGYPDSPTFTF